MKKAILLVILVAELAFPYYWQHRVDKAERRYLASYSRNLGWLTRRRIWFLDPKQTEFFILEDLKKNAQALGINPSNIGITPQKISEMAPFCHRNTARRLYAEMKDLGFSPGSYNRLKAEAKQAGLNVKDLFAPAEVQIDPVNHDGQLIYYTGWRPATRQEAAEFKAIEKEESKKRQEQMAQWRKEAVEEQKRHEKCLLEHPKQFFLVVNGKEVEITETYTLKNAIEEIGGGFLNIRISEPTECGGRLVYDPTSCTPVLNKVHLFVTGDYPDDYWTNTGKGYEVRTYIDVAALLAEDGLTIVDGYIY